MSKDTYLKDPVGSRQIINEMPSGLIHLADSLGGGRTGRFILRQGSPGDPMGSSSRESGDILGKVPDLFTFSNRRSQRTNV